MAYKNKASDTAWRKKNAAHLRKYHRAWIKDHPEAASDYSRTARTAVKIEVLSHYGKGGKLMCCWPKCKIKDVDMLTLDHEKDDGAKKRKNGEKTGYNGYRDLRKLNYSDGYQTLCCNHNQKKEMMRRR